MQKSRKFIGYILGINFSNPKSTKINLITESVQVGQWIGNALLDLCFNGVVVVLGALGENVLGSF